MEYPVYPVTCGTSKQEMIKHGKLYEQILFHIFYLVFHVESLPCSLVPQVTGYSVYILM